MANYELYYTAVQHSAYGVQNDGRYKWGLETQAVVAPEQIKKVKQAGGVLFRTYEEAEVYIHNECYPDYLNGLYPRCTGTFSRKRHNGLRIYVPDQDMPAASHTGAQWATQPNVRN